MNAFFQHHKDSIRFAYRCFDRKRLSNTPVRQSVTLRTFLPSGRSFFSHSVRTGRDRLCLVARA